MTENMKKVIDFLDSTNLFYVATIENGDQPRVRPIGNAIVYKDKLYFMTSRDKRMYNQMKENNKVEICAFTDGDWIRITGEVFEDDCREVKVMMLDKNPLIRNSYNEDDDLMTMFYFEKAEVFTDSLYAPSSFFEI